MKYNYLNNLDTLNVFRYSIKYFKIINIIIFTNYGIQAKLELPKISSRL